MEHGSSGDTCTRPLHDGAEFHLRSPGRWAEAEAGAAPAPEAVVVAPGATGKRRRVPSKKVAGDDDGAGGGDGLAQPKRRRRAPERAAAARPDAPPAPPYMPGEEHFREIRVVCGVKCRWCYDCARCVRPLAVAICGNVPCGARSHNLFSLSQPDFVQKLQSPPKIAELPPKRGSARPAGAAGGSFRRRRRCRRRQRGQLKLVLLPLRHSASPCFAFLCVILWLR
jgi:hypothetical protein